MPKTVLSLRKLIERPGLIPAPGAYDALSAKLIEAVGFQVIYITGSGVAAAQYGFPDLGLLMLMEMVEQARKIISAVKIPVIVDADTGYGGPLNVCRTIKEYESLGVAAIHLEDQEWPKRCGHFEGKKLISKEAMVQKIHAAVDARQDPEFIIIARTDAIAVEGFNSAIARGQEYASAGADILFVDAPNSMDQVNEIPKRINKPVLINMDFLGKTPWLSKKDLENAGYKIAIYPGIPQFSALAASREILEQLHTKGTINEAQVNSSCGDDFLELTNKDEATSWEDKYDF